MFTYLIFFIYFSKLKRRHFMLQKDKKINWLYYHFLTHYLIGVNYIVVSKANKITFCERQYISNEIDRFNIKRSVYNLFSYVVIKEKKLDLICINSFTKLGFATDHFHCRTAKRRSPTTLLCNDNKSINFICDSITKQSFVTNNIEIGKSIDFVDNKFSNSIDFVDNKSFAKQSFATATSFNTLEHIVYHSKINAISYVLFPSFGYKFPEIRLYETCRNTGRAKQNRNASNFLEKENCCLVRPLLSVSRFEINKICSFWQLPIFPDTSNQKVKFLRNRVRKQLLPSVKFFFNSKIENVLLQFANIVEIDNQCLGQITKELFTTFVSPNEIFVSSANLNKKLFLAKIHSPIFEPFFKNFSNFFTKQSFVTDNSIDFVDNTASNSVATSLLFYLSTSLQSFALLRVTPFKFKKYGVTRNKAKLCKEVGTKSINFADNKLPRSSNIYFHNLCKSIFLYIYLKNTKNFKYLTKIEIEFFTIKNSILIQKIIFKLCQPSILRRNFHYFNNEPTSSQSKALRPVAAIDFINSCAKESFSIDSYRTSEASESTMPCLVRNEKKLIHVSPLLLRKKSLYQLIVPTPTTLSFIAIINSLQSEHGCLPLQSITSERGSLSTPLQSFALQPMTSIVGQRSVGVGEPYFFTNQRFALPIILSTLWILVKRRNLSHLNKYKSIDLQLAIKLLDLLWTKSIDYSFFQIICSKKLSTKLIDLLSVRKTKLWESIEIMQHRSTRSICAKQSFIQANNFSNNEETQHLNRSSFLRTATLASRQRSCHKYKQIFKKVQSSALQEASEYSFLKNTIFIKNKCQKTLLWNNKNVPTLRLLKIEDYRTVISFVGKKSFLLQRHLPFIYTLTSKQTKTKNRFFLPVQFYQVNKDCKRPRKEMKINLLRQNFLAKNQKFKFQYSVFKMNVDLIGVPITSIFLSSYLLQIYKNIVKNLFCDKKWDHQYWFGTNSLNSIDFVDNKSSNSVATSFAKLGFATDDFQSYASLNKISNRFFLFNSLHGKASESFNKKFSFYFLKNLKFVQKQCRLASFFLFNLTKTSCYGEMGNVHLARFLEVSNMETYLKNDKKLLKTISDFTEKNMGTYVESVNCIDFVDSATRPCSILYKSKICTTKNFSKKQKLYQVLTSTINLNYFKTMALNNQFSMDFSPTLQMPHKEMPDLALTAKRRSSLKNTQSFERKKECMQNSALYQLSTTKSDVSPLSTKLKDASLVLQIPNRCKKEDYNFLLPIFFCPRFSMSIKSSFWVYNK